MKNSNHTKSESKPQSKSCSADRKTPVYHRHRNYKIIDSESSQKILEQFIVERTTAFRINEKLWKSRKSILSSRSLPLQRQPSTLPSFDTKCAKPADITSQPKIADILRTSSFNRYNDVVGHLSTETNRSHRNSLPLSNSAFRLKEPTIFEADDNCTAAMISPLDIQHSPQNACIDSGNSETTDRDQRSSFVSTSTGYSSARSSLRSSDTGDDAHLFHDTGVPKKLLSRESSLSEARRLKILKNSSVSHLDRLAIELLETERSYVNDLNDVIQGYLNFFVDHREEFQMTVDDVSSTFGCIERIFLFNKRLYHQLDAALLNVVQMSRCFIDNVADFKDYVTYCTNYQKMIDALTNLMKNDAVADTLALRQTILGHSLPLSAYLLKPVQRVLKYHLFLENILKSSIDCKMISDVDRSIISQATNCMTKQAEEINETKKRTEHFERVRELQNALQRWSLDKSEDLCKYGDLLLEDTFKLSGTKANRQLFLFEEMLLIVKERNGVLICKDYIMCSSLMLNESVQLDPLAFQVLSCENPRMRYIFIASSLEQKRRWTKSIKRMMLDHNNVEIPERIKLLVLSIDDNQKCNYMNEIECGTEFNSKMRCQKLPQSSSQQRKSMEISSILTQLNRSNNWDADKRRGTISRAHSVGNLTAKLAKSNRNPQSECGCGEKITSHHCASTFIPNSHVNRRASLTRVSDAIVTRQNKFRNKFTRRKSKGDDEQRRLSTKRGIALQNEQDCMNGSVGGVIFSDQSYDEGVSSHSTHALHSSCKCDGTCAQSIAKTQSGNCIRRRLSRIQFQPCNLPETSNEKSCGIKCIDTDPQVRELYEECMLFSADMNSTERSRELANVQRQRIRQQAAMNRLNAVVNGTCETNPTRKDRSECGWPHSNVWHRSKSLGKLHDLLNFPTKSRNNCQNSIDNRLIKATENHDSTFGDSSDQDLILSCADDDSDAFLNGSKYDLCEEACTYKNQISEEENHSNFGTYLIPGSDRFMTPQNVHHRRRSSQVAQQVWRFRQKQSIEKSSEMENRSERESSYIPCMSQINGRRQRSEQWPSRQTTGACEQFH